ncbi:hypothetical protein BAZOLSSOX_1744 [uncultured Gammaproteobacteria bacterium]|nr:hypothetical protein BAZOLSSOX_1744 [uncultured Gammaproteobacteria bacterium]
MGETVFWLKSLCQLGFVYFFGFYFWYFQNPKIEPPNPKNTNQNPEKTTPFQVLHP